MISSDSGFRYHVNNDFMEHKEKAEHGRSAQRDHKVSFLVDMKSRNFERGHQCRGQGCRHQNAAVHTQKHTGRNAKWSSTATAAKSRKNYKSVQ